MVGPGPELLSVTDRLGSTSEKMETKNSAWEPSTGSVPSRVAVSVAEVPGGTAIEPPDCPPPDSDVDTLTGAHAPVASTTLPVAPDWGDNEKFARGVPPVTSK